MMFKPDNIRNVSVIAHVDHGKTTATDQLVQKNGIIGTKGAGTMRYTDTRADEQERCITIKATTISLMHNYTQLIPDPSCAKVEDAKDLPMAKKTTPILVNLIDSPGHMDFTAEVTASLRVTDGALIVVDCTKGVQSQTHTVTKQAVYESIKFILLINKFDTLFNTLAMTSESCESQELAYIRMNTVVTDLNAILYNLTNENKGPYSYDNICLDMMKGNVVMGSGKQGFGLTIKSAFDFVYREKLAKGMQSHGAYLEYEKIRNKLMPKFWGDNFIDITNKKTWKKTTPITNEDKAKFWRGACYLIFKVLLEIRELCQANDHSELKKYIQDPDNFVFPTDVKELEKAVLQNIFPLAEVVMDAMAAHLPSPLEAAKYRADNLSTEPNAKGPLTTALRECRHDGPFVAFCSKKVPFGDLARPTIYTVIRIFSGTLHSDTKLVCYDENYQYNEETQFKQDMHCKHNGIYIMIGKMTELVKSMPCGNVCGVKGLDKYLPGTGTIVEAPAATDPHFPSPLLLHPLKNMKHMSYPIVGARLKPQDNGNLSKLYAAAALLKKLDNTCVVIHDAEGITINGNGRLHVEILTKDIKEMFGKPVIETDQVIKLAETCTSSEPKRCLTKSPNMHNRFFAYAYPIDDDLTNYIDSFTNPDGFTWEKANQEGYKLPASVDMKNLKLTSDNVKRILMCENGNILYNGTTGFDYMDDMKDSLIAGFLSGISNGMYAEERVRGMMLLITDITCHADAIHRGAAQVVPAMTRLTRNAISQSAPSLLEPVYKIILEGEDKHSSGVQSEMNKLGAILQNVDQDNTTMMLEYSLSMYKSKDIHSVIMSASSGTWSTQLQFDGYEPIEGDITDETSYAYKRLMEKRVEKGLEAVLPKHNLDTL